MAHYHTLSAELTVADVENFFSMDINKSRSINKEITKSSYKGKCYDPNPNTSQTPYETRNLKSNFKMFDEMGEGFDEDEDDETSVDPFGSLVSGDLDNIEVETISPLNSTVYNVAVDKNKLNVYDHYTFTHKYNDDLPINTYMTEILENISVYPVTIIQGATGSGKTTQVPQFILDESAREKKYCNIVVTQPRKIAAMSIARRVCEERNWDLGYLVGYHVGLDKKTSEDTRITYVTTGVLLRQLIKAKNLHNFTHIILDEVHERDQDTDFAMLLVRKLLWTNSRHVKVILMSATLDSNVLADYFGSPVAGSVSPAPTLSVDGKMFDVEKHYIDELSGLGKLPEFCSASPEISEEAYIIACNLILHLDQLEQDERDANSSTSKDSDTFRGSVLVFLPGLFYIRELEDRLSYHKVMKKLTVIPLHSSITLEEQYLVFRNPKPDYRKIILSTNIAESSITVPDIKYVVDFCLTKSLICDVDTNYQSLRLQWASQASAKQRAGRAGRVSNGKVYRLVTREFYNFDLEEYSTPEMQTCSLESVILKVKVLDLGDPKSILHLAVSPPDLHNIERTILLLKQIGALSTTANQKRYDGQLTFVGTVLASLPIDMHLGKLVMLGYGFGCFSDCLIIAAALSKPSFFATPYHKTVEAYAKKLFWAQGSFSDCFAFLNAYKAWYKCSQTQRFLRSSDEKRWCNENFLQYRRIREVHHQVEELRDRLRHFNISSDDGDYWSEAESRDQKLFILKIVMAAAFYPNYFLQSAADEPAAVKEMSLLDPSRTVAFRGLPSGKGFLYRDSLLKLTRPCGKQKAIYYDGSKVFVEFEKSNDIDTGNVLPAVYIASKLRSVRSKYQLQQTFAEKPLDVRAGHRLPTFLYESLESDSHVSEVPRPGSPPWFSIQVTHVESSTILWGNKLLSSNVSQITKIGEEINKSMNSKASSDDARVGGLVLAPFDDGELIRYYRALVTSSQPNIKVWFVDYGNSSFDLKVHDLRKLPASLADIPFQAVQFRLRGVKKTESVSGEEAKLYLLSLLEPDGHVAEVKIYSVVSDVVCVDLFTLRNHYVNDILIQRQFCEVSEEGKVSEISHSSWVLAEEHGVSDEKTFSEKFSSQWVKLDPSLRGSVLPGNGQLLTVFAPRTSYEETFTSCVNIGRMRNVTVDSNSINSICINQHPGDPTRIMMVAGEVGINQSGSTMIVRNTTILPCVKGLMQLICVLFSPVVEFRTNEEQTRLTGAICGLGAHKTPRGIFSVLPDHDIELHFDTEFTLEDIIEINGIRMIINLVVGSDEKRASWGRRAVHHLQKKARHQLMSLLLKQRPSVKETPSRRPYTWGLISEESEVDHGIKDQGADLKDFYRLHAGTLLRDQHDSRGYV